MDDSFPETKFSKLNRDTFRKSIRRIRNSELFAIQESSENDPLRVRPAYLGDF